MSFVWTDFARITPGNFTSCDEKDEGRFRAEFKEYEAAHRAENWELRWDGRLYAKRLA